MLGSGAWGTAVASVLAYNGFRVNLWCHEPEVAEMVAEKNCNKRYLPDTNLSERIVPFTSMQRALQGVEWVFEAVPVKFLRSVLEQVKPYYKDSQKWVVLSKGIENKTLLFSSEILDHVFNTQVKKVVVSGPSFAKEVAAQQVTAVDIASDDKELAFELYKILTSDYFRAHLIDDPLGAQIGGALKNIVAIATGMLYGGGHADNTKALLLTRVLHEIVNFAMLWGAKKDTVYGLSGFGDLSLTCMGSLSRNLMVGKKLGAGETLKDILSSTHAVPEGVNTVKSVHEMIQQWRSSGQALEFRVFEAIYDVIFRDKTVDDLIHVLKE